MLSLGPRILIWSGKVIGEVRDTEYMADVRVSGLPGRFNLRAVDHEAILDVALEGAFERLVDLIGP